MPSNRPMHAKVGTDHWGVRYVESSDDVGVFSEPAGRTPPMTSARCWRSTVARGELASLIGPDGLASDVEARRCVGSSSPAMSSRTHAGLAGPLHVVRRWDRALPRDNPPRCRVGASARARTSARTAPCADLAVAVADAARVISPPAPSPH